MRKLLFRKAERNAIVDAANKAFVSFAVDVKSPGYSDSDHAVSHTYKFVTAAGWAEANVSCSPRMAHFYFKFSDVAAAAVVLANDRGCWQGALSGMSGKCDDYALPSVPPLDRTTGAMTMIANLRAFMTMLGVPAAEANIRAQEGVH